MLTADALADLIAAKLRPLLIPGPVPTVIDEYINAVADALEAEFACTCETVRLDKVHYDFCPALYDYNAADWIARAKGEG